MDQSKFTIIIPSKIIDENLINCEKKIRKFYQKIKILLMVDYNQNNVNFSSFTEVVTTGLVNVSEKRNMGFKLTNSEFIVFIDSDAYPEHPWLDNIENVFKKNEIIGACGGPNLSPNSETEEKKFISSIKKSAIVSQNVKFVKNKKFQSKMINFLPTCNLIVKSSIFQNKEPMDNKLFAHEDISINENIKKNGYKIYYEPSAYVFHKDRSIKSFLKQRFIYGSESLNVFIKYPCKSSFNLLISTIPFISLLLLIINYLFNKDLLINSSSIYSYIHFMLLIVIIFAFFLILAESIKVFLIYKKSFFKILTILFLSVFLPGLGQTVRPFLNWTLRRKIWVQ